MRSESLVHISFVVGITLSGLSLSLLVAAILLRVSYGHRERATRMALRSWYPYFLNRAVGQAVSPPPAGAEATAVLALWLDFMESVGGPVRDRLRQALADTRLGDIAAGLLDSPLPSEQMLAIGVVGHARDVRQWDRLNRLLTRKGLPSLLAARAMVQMKPAEALPIVVAKMRRREDWPLPTVASMMLEEDRTLVASALRNEFRNAEADEEARCQAFILDLLASVGGPEAQEPIARALDPTRPSGVILAALRASQRPGNPVDPDPIRALLNHSDPAIRAEAARALGRIGSLGDDDLLRALLGDEDAWVRYCAAQAISYLPWITLDDLRRIRDESSDPRIRSVLEQVASEEVSAAATLEAATSSEQRLPVKFLREFIGHPNWKIRLQAVERLLLSESREGQRTLSQLLQDERWWTQYEAARRLVQRSFVDARVLRRLLEVEGDPRSQSIFALVARERSL